jgi:hypothetical protein
VEDNQKKQETDKECVPSKILMFNKNMDPLSNFIYYLSHKMSSDKLTFISPLIIMYISTMSILLNGLKVNILLQGDPSIGKSHLLNWVMKCIPESTHRTWSTDPSSNHLFTKGANNKSIQSIFAHEGSSFITNGKDVDKKAKELFKTLLSEATISKQVLEFDPIDGSRIGSNYITETHVNVIAATNVLPHEFDKNVMTRFIVFFLLPSGNIKEGMRKEEINKTINCEGQHILQETMRDLYTLCYMVLLGIKKKAISDITNVLTDIILDKIEGSFKSYGISINEASRGYEQIKSIIKLLTIMGAVIEVCLTPGGECFDKDFDYQVFYKAIDSRLWVSMQTVITAVCLCFDTFQSEAQVNLIKFVFEKELKFTDTLNKFEKNILRLNTDKEYNKNSHHNTSIKEEYINSKGKKCKVFYGCTDQSEYSLSRFNYNYHLFIASYSHSDQIIYRKVVGKIKGQSDKNVWIDMNYVSFKVEDTLNFFNEASKSVIESLKTSYVIPKNVLRFVKKEHFETIKSNFYTCTQVQACHGKTFVEADDYLRENCSHVRCDETGDGIFMPLLKDNHYYEHSDHVYDPKTGIPLVIVEDYDPIFEKATNSTYQSIEERQQKRKTYKQVSFAIELYRLKFKLLLEKAITNLSYDKMKERDVMMFMLDDEVYKTISLKPDKNVKLEVNNPNYIKEDKRRIINSLSSYNDDKNNGDVSVFKTVKTSEVLGQLDISENSDDYIDKESYNNTEKTYFSELREIYSKKKIVINQDLDLFAKRIHGERTGVSYEELEVDELPQKEIYEKYRKCMTEEYNGVFKDDFDYYDKNDVSLNASSKDTEEEITTTFGGHTEDTNNTSSNGNDNSHDSISNPNFRNHKFVNKHIGSNIN